MAALFVCVANWFARPRRQLSARAAVAAAAPSRPFFVRAPTRLASAAPLAAWLRAKAGARARMFMCAASAEDVALVKPAEVAEYTGNGFKVLDVRTTGEFAQGRIKGAVLVPLMNRTEDGQMVPNGAFEQQVQEKVSTDHGWLVVCGSGMRSARACKILTQKLGFDRESLRDVAGGMQAYASAQLPVEQ